MHLLTLSAILGKEIGPWLAILGFGAFHGLNPGMGWLFALSIGLQQGKERAVWISLLPIAAGHAASILLIAILIMAGGYMVSSHELQILTAIILLLFGIYKIFNFYRHPRWVGMKVNNKDLFLWSFLMATAHGAGLMIAPALLEVSSPDHNMNHNMQMSDFYQNEIWIAITIHSLIMLLVMGIVAWIVYKKLGLITLRKKWINFDLIWAIALIITGSIAFYHAF